MTRTRIVPQLVLASLCLTGCGSSSSNPPGYDATSHATANDNIAPTPACGIYQNPTTSDSIELRWQPASDNEAVRGYRIERDGAKVGFVTESKFIDPHVQPNTFYNYTIVALDDDGLKSAPTRAKIKTPVAAKERQKLEQNGITWTFERTHKSGQYLNGDWWVVGPVNLTSITGLHAEGFLPEEGKDGSMINPSGGNLQGYDSSLANYDRLLNAAIVNDEKLGADNPLTLHPHNSLVSSISWLYKSPSDAEPGMPSFNEATGTPRPALRTSAVLTVVDDVVNPGSFRPAYSGSIKSSLYLAKNLSDRFLRNLPPPKTTPRIGDLESAIEKHWLDHVNGWLGAYLHPSENMPHYGRDIAILTGTIGSTLHLDFCELPGRPAKQRLLHLYVQLGIDLAGIAKSGGDWSADGGHGAGRRWPIFFANLLLKERLISKADIRTTPFQETENTFYITESDIASTSSSEWNPDFRDLEIIPYSADELGIPEWGIRRATEPERSNLYWGTTYRTINHQALAGTAISVLLTGQRADWGGDPLLDYMDRVHAFGSFDHPAGTKDHDRFTYGSPFLGDMWRFYRSLLGPVWTPDDPNHVYSKGSR